jgi:LmbE family N-acetylglucosaminyl deacetylase
MKPVPFSNAAFGASSKCMVILAHQDDEVTFAGLLQRLPANTQFLWTTNGDGLSDGTGLSDKDYAEKRRLETIAAMKIAGVGEDRLRFLGHSEKEIYAKIASLDDEAPKFSQADVMSYFRGIASQVRAEVLAFKPDTIITHAWQGGQPEHDLTHYMAVRAASHLKKCRIFEVPEYELAFSVFLRFPPWRHAPVHEIHLNASEIAVKRAMFNCYETQKEGMTLSVIMMSVGDVVERAAALLSGHGRPTESFPCREQFGPVPADRDYTKCPHRLDHLEYIGDDWQGRPISFLKMIVPIVCAIER